ncbi:TPM domain-containing protein [Parasphingopyxis lamellibrachiae]|uniref:TLP18.3/Psb32/MOLO-1 phosphatase superfamily protein n=1 Tax=Parasphingopyxis lamellibrachiae TaxID=680125 RepID=A0A3D9FG91_9SPHN|nr:TPM domain-containing protein [Parasphingopyxis lamellibrachiae]RED16809.1 TLP18.3/Psb32/MOLO-1 phosphatase superfamily protein [Parasphingopyxis lamellibrachiae]
MKLIHSIPAGAIGLALTLTACSGEAATADSDDMATEEAVDESGEEAAAVEHDTSGYAEDATGGLIDAALIASLNEKLAGFHGDSGRDIHIIAAMSTDGRDIEEVAEEMRAERGADALIYVAGADQALAIVGEGLDEAFTTDAEVAMIAHFEEDELAEGLNSGADALIARLGN